MAATEEQRSGADPRMRKASGVPVYLTARAYRHNRRIKVHPSWPWTRHIVMPGSRT